MPIISEFEGMQISIHTETTGKHHEPHVHVTGDKTNAAVSLDGEVLAGTIRSDKLKILRRWLFKRSVELAIQWAKASAGEKTSRIEPLRKGE